MSPRRRTYVKSCAAYGWVARESSCLLLLSEQWRWCKSKPQPPVDLEWLRHDLLSYLTDLDRSTKSSGNEGRTWTCCFQVTLLECQQLITVWHDRITRLVNCTFHREQGILSHDSVYMYDADFAVQPTVVDMHLFPDWAQLGGHPCFLFLRILWPKAVKQHLLWEATKTVPTLSKEAKSCVWMHIGFHYEHCLTVNWTPFVCRCWLETVWIIL